ncbi:hypothetical protein EST38_g10875 [Candolleomyces aberdarensis]|uniref:Uncharacterized protein n=1 Tax=Candolleomyces aberdarensis TaxID=2316362 RepID=A0A4V1Q2G2_9AGAR|nr:hypothetical protein EST38_g10875 [Candolleomyces aberdarensis]
MVAIHVLTALLLSITAIKARAEPIGFYDEANEIAVRELVEDIILREVGPDYADLVDREPIWGILKAGAQLVVKHAGTAAKVAGKANELLGGGGGGGENPADVPLTQQDINNNGNFKTGIKFEVPKQPKRKRNKQKKNKQKKRGKGKREFLDEEDDMNILQRDFEELVERAAFDAADSLEERVFGGSFGEMDKRSFFDEQDGLEEREFDFDGEELEAREFEEDEEELLMRDFEDASWLDDLN